MNKVLVSWLGVEKDFNNGEVNFNGPTVNFYKHYYEHDFHILLVTENQIEKGLKFKKTIEEKFPNIYVILKPQDITGVHWNLKAIKNKAEQVLLELKNYNIDILFSTGSAIMKIAWFLLHYSLGLNTRLLQILKPEESSSKTKPDLYVLDFETSQIPIAAIIRQEIISQRIKQELILTTSYKKIYDKALRVAHSEKTDILITGEYGTGKEELARYIHNNSPTRSQRAFLKIDASAVSEEIFYYKLFGYKKGAFPGAIHDYKGLLTEAHGGTIYIENFDKLSLKSQALLRKFLEDRRVEPIVGRDKHVNVRVIISSTKGYKDLFKDENINKDLLYLLAVRLHLPAFRKLNVDEKKQFIEQFIAQKLKLFRKKDLKFCNELWHFFLSYEFPGNFIELHSVIDALIIMSEKSEVCIEELPEYIESEEVPSSLLLEDVEKKHIERVLKMFKGNKTRTAKALGIALNTLKKKIKDYNIKIEEEGI